MLHKFNEDNIETKFIKSILASYYVPTVPFWHSGDSIIKDFTYITKNNILLAKESWTDGANERYTAPISENDSSWFKIISPYIENNKYLNITSNYISNSSLYDSETHLYLGKYLKFYRDYHNIDLMPYYNCCVDIKTDRLRIDNVHKAVPNLDDKKLTGDFSVTEDGVVDNYKVYTIPIEYNNNYTIFIDSDCGAIITAACWDGTNVLGTFKTDFIESSKLTYTTPILFNAKQVAAEGRMDMYYRKFLKLLIQVPKTCNRVVILDGDYRKSVIALDSNKFGYNHLPEVKVGFTDEYRSYDDFEKEDIDNICKVYSPLLRSTENKLVTYDDKLIEFLLLNVISDQDDITKNVERVQQYASSYSHHKANGTIYDKAFTKGVWDNNLRVFLYNLVTRPSKNISKNTKAVGVDGYVDKDVEAIITRGQDV